MPWPKGKERGTSPLKGRKLGPRKLPKDAVGVLQFYAAGGQDDGELAAAVLRKHGHELAEIFEDDPNQMELPGLDSPPGV